jgi:hypothetical protein
MLLLQLSFGFVVLNGAASNMMKCTTNFGVGHCTSQKWGNGAVIQALDNVRRAVPL